MAAPVSGSKSYRNPYGLVPMVKPAGVPATVPGPVVSMAPAVQRGGVQLAAEPATGRTLALVFLAAVAIYFFIRNE